MYKQLQSINKKIKASFFHNYECGVVECAQYKWYDKLVVQDLDTTLDWVYLYNDRLDIRIDSFLQTIFEDKNRDTNNDIDSQLDFQLFHFEVLQDRKCKILPSLLLLH